MTNSETAILIAIGFIGLAILRTLVLWLKYGGIAGEDERVIVSILSKGGF